MSGQSRTGGDGSPILTAEAAAESAFGFSHPLAPETGCTMQPLSRRLGMTASAVNLVRVAPGRQAFPAHRHHAEEEWVYVVSGTADVAIDGTWHRLAAGGFAAFLPGGPAHAVRNAGADTLVCLMGGSQPAAEVVDFPTLAKRIVFTGAGASISEMADQKPFDFAAAMRPPGAEAAPGPGEETR